MEDFIGCTFVFDVDGTICPIKGKEEQYEKLRYNIDPREHSKGSYLKKNFAQSPERCFDEPDKHYRIHREDMATIKNKKYSK